MKRIEAELAARIEQCQTEIGRQQEELARQQEEFEARRAKFEEAERALAEGQLALERQRGQHDSEMTQLESLRENLSRRAADLDSRQEQVEALRLRTEEQRRRVAREFRTRRSELTQASRRAPEPESPAPGRQAPRPMPPAAPGRLNWEAEKQRILAALESEDATEESSGRRTEIEEVIRATENALADKDREIEEMKQILDSQAGNIGQMAVGAAALGEVLDQDALIREGRENLNRLQEEWEEKLRRAEIDISVERAKLARDRAELEEKLRNYEHHRQKDEPPPGQSVTKSRGRWLARLGIKEDPPEGA